VADGIASAIRQAKATAGEKQVTVIGGASTTQQRLRARLADDTEDALNEGAYPPQRDKEHRDGFMIWRAAPNVAASPAGSGPGQLQERRT